MPNVYYKMAKEFPWLADSFALGLKQWLLLEAFLLLRLESLVVRLLIFVLPVALISHEDKR
jgi:hypothetical protein